MAVRTRVAAFAAALAAVAVQVNAAPPAPQTIYVGGHVVIPNGKATAMAVRDGLIAAVGSDRRVQALAGPDTQVVPLNGRTVFPGLYDMHVHPFLAGSGEEGACRIDQGVTPTVLLETVSACVRAAKSGEWVTGGQWQASSMGATPITAATLDAIAPDNPVMLFDVSGHSLWVNSRALVLAGIGRATPDPEGGIIERDAAGNPTGILRETARNLVIAKIPPATPEQSIRGLKASLDRMLSYGITSFVEPYLFRDGLQAYATLSDRGQLVQHVQGCMAYSAAGQVNPDLPALIADRGRYTRPNFRTDCVKVFADGVPTESHTGAMLADYADQGEGKPPRGLLLFDPVKFNPLMAEWDKAGLTVVFHAAGDAAVRASLDAVAYARSANGSNGPMHQIGHSTFIDPVDLPRAKTLNAAYEFSPYLWNPQPINDDIGRAVGPERAARAWPMRSAFASDALVIGGSDWAVVPAPDPWLGIETAITRRTPDTKGPEWAGGEAITRTQAIAMFTRNAARRLGDQRRSGTLEIGKAADFLILDRNPTTIPSTEIHKVGVLQTYIDGRKVFDRDNPPKLSVTMFKGGFATVNSFVFSNGTSLAVLDVQRKREWAEKLADMVKAMRLPLKTVLISHGHTDHFTGMPVFRREFPDAKIMVANEAIRRDIKAYAIYMDGFGATPAEPVLDPLLKPQSDAVPNGFDYENTIGILQSDTIVLEGGGTLELTSDYGRTEAPHMTTVYSPDLNALFLADFGYNKVHIWAGDDISRADLRQWQTELHKIKARYASLNPVVYPGHGDPTDLRLIDRTVRYIDDFLAVTARAKSREEAIEQMIALYPDYAEANFFLKYSVEAHVKP